MIKFFAICIFLILCTIFMHIIDDFCLQQVLARLKQKKYWEDIPEENYKHLNQKKSFYKNDYKVALLAHAFEWTFMIHIPSWIMAFGLEWKHISFILEEKDPVTSLKVIGIMLFLFFGNIVIHYVIDDLKANKGYLNLVMDQLVHVVQCICTVIVYVSLCL